MKANIVNYMVIKSENRIIRLDFVDKMCFNRFRHSKRRTSAWSFSRKNTPTPGMWQ